MSRSSGFQHRKAINTPGHAHELTFSCYHKFQSLKAERTCQWLADSIQSAREKHSFDLWAFVFMPEHAHLIVLPRDPEYEMRQIMAGIKLPVAKHAIAYLELHDPSWLVFKLESRSRFCGFHQMQRQGTETNFPLLESRFAIC